MSPFSSFSSMLIVMIAQGGGKVPDGGGCCAAGLLCLKQAKEGGLSAWSSSTTVHNEIVARAPELARVLAARGAWFYDRKGEIPEGSNGLPFFELPVFNYHKVLSNYRSLLCVGQTMP